jgi:hypothetical protein
MKRLAVKTKAALIAAGLFSGAVVLPVQAGEWVLDRYECSGANSWIPAPPGASPQPWPTIATGADAPNGFYKQVGAAENGSGQAASFTVQATSSGTITPVFKWIPTAGQTLETNPPPPFLNVLITSNATTNNYHGASGSQSYQWTASLRNGTLQKDTADIPAKEFSELKHVRLLRVAAGSEYVSIPARTLHADGKIVSTAHPISYSGYTSYNATVMTGVSSSVSFQAKEDNRNRGVRLYRPGAIDEWVDAEGNTHGDTVYSVIQTNGGLHRTNYQHIHAVCEGFTPSAPATWQWNPPGGHIGLTTVEDTWDCTLQKMPTGSLYFNQNHPQQYVGEASGNTTLTINYKATDAFDGAEATAKYFLTLHDEAERSGPDEVRNVLVEGIMWTGNSTTVVWGYAPQGSQEIATGTAKSSGWSFGGGVDVSPAAWKELASFNVGGEYSSSHEESVTQNAILPFDVPADHYTYPMFRHTYVRTKIPFRHWTPEGEHKIIVHNSPHPDDELDHYFVKDVYSGQQIFWHEPIRGVGEGSQPAPTHDPNEPPPMTPVED